jgi:DinB family protein
MSGKQIDILRQQLGSALKGDQSHLDFASALKDFPVDMRGHKPASAPHSAWQLLEHLRIAQHDILEFSRNPKYKSPKWPEGYWPDQEMPPDPQAWDASIEAFKKDARTFAKLVQNEEQDLFKPLAHGDGQNLLREALVLAAHNSYHLGQLVFLKKSLVPQGH